MTSLSLKPPTPCKPLPKHKMAVLTFFGLLLPVYFIPAILFRFFPEQKVLVLVLSVAAIVALMSYFIMPVLTWIFRGWIGRGFQQRQG